MKSQNGQEFSTVDEDNDSDSDSNCAKDRGGGWWFSDCGQSSLNGKCVTAENEDPGTGGIRWETLEPETYSFNSTVMKIERN